MFSINFPATAPSNETRNNNQKNKEQILKRILKAKEDDFKNLSSQEGLKGDPIKTMEFSISGRKREDFAKALQRFEKAFSGYFLHWLLKFH